LKGWPFAVGSTCSVYSHVYLPAPSVAAQVVDADTQKAMMAWYYKRQEEEKVWHCANHHQQQQEQTLPARLLHASIAAARRYIQTARYVPGLAYSTAAKALQRRDDARVSCLIDSVLGLHGTIAGLLSVCLFHFTVPYRLSPKTMMMHSLSQSGPTPSHSSSTLQALGQSGCRTDRANGHGNGWHAAAARGVSVLGWLPVFAPQ
jgi:hypothetical protein